MSLRNRIIALILFVLSLSFVGIFYYQLKQTEDFLINQQEVEMDNTINMLGLALLPAIEKKDSLQVETLLMAAFDGSFYERVNYQHIGNAADNLEFEYPSAFSEVPSWFLMLFEMDPIEKQKVLTSGWSKVAKITVVSNTAFASNKLWESGKSIFFNMIISFAAVYVVITLLTQLFVGKPLSSLLDNIKQVAQHQFEGTMTIPSTPEFRVVAVEFNKMREKLDQFFKLQADETENFRKRAYQDSVTQLANRDFVMVKLRSWLSSDEHGGMLIISMDYLDELYEQGEYRKGDEIAKAFANKMQSYIGDENTLGRSKPNEFIFIAPHASTLELTELANEILSVTCELQPNYGDDVRAQSAIAVLMKDEDANLSKMLTMADNALHSARHLPNDPIYVVGTADTKPIYGRMQWRKIIEESIKQNKVGMTTQAAVNAQHKPIYQEVFSSINYEDEVFNAGIFLPNIEKHELGAEFDKHVIESVFKRLAEEVKSTPYAINLTLHSLNDSLFMSWLADTLKEHAVHKDHVLFEIPEIAFIKTLDYTKVFCNLLREHGFSFGIDNFGHNFSAIEYLKQVNPDYVKLDFAYTCNLDQESKVDVLRFITQSALNLDIEVIATRIETTQQIEELSQFAINGFQGFVVKSLDLEV